MRVYFFKIQRFQNLDSLPSEGRIEVADGSFYELPIWFDQLDQVKPNLPNPSLYDDEDDREVERYYNDIAEATKGLVELRPLARKDAVGGGNRINSLPSKIWVTEESFPQLSEEIRKEIDSFTREMVSKEEDRIARIREIESKRKSEEEKYSSIRNAVQDRFQGSIVRKGWRENQFSIEIEGVKIEINIMSYDDIDSLVEKINRNFTKEREVREAKEARKKDSERKRAELINSGKVAAVYNSSGEVVQYYELNGRTLNVHQDAMGHLIGSRGSAIQRAQKELGMRINLKPTLSGRLPRKATFKWL